MTKEISKKVVTVKRKKVKIVIKLKNKPIKNTKESKSTEVDYIKSLSSLYSFFFYYFPHLDGPQIFVTDCKNNKYIARMEMLDTSIEISNKYNTFETAYKNICNYGLQFLKKFVSETSIPMTDIFREKLSKILSENELNSNLSLSNKKDVEILEIHNINTDLATKNNFCFENYVKMASIMESVPKEVDKNFTQIDEKGLKFNTLNHPQPKANPSINDIINQEKNKNKFENKFHKEDKEIYSFDSSKIQSLEYSNLVKEICVSNRLQFPEYTIEKQNGVFICYASFFEREFISDYFFDKIQAKEDVNRLINEWIVSSKVISSEKNAIRNINERTGNSIIKDGIKIESDRFFTSTNQPNTKSEIPCEQNVEMDLIKLINQAEVQTGFFSNTAEPQQNFRKNPGFFSRKKYFGHQMKNSHNRKNRRRWQFLNQKINNSGNDEISHRNTGNKNLYKTSELSSFWTSDNFSKNSQNVPFSSEKKTFETINTNNDLYFERNKDFNSKKYKTSDNSKYFENTFLENP